MRKLSLKNKLFVFIFTFIILLIVSILIFAARKVGASKSKVYTVTSNTVLFAKDTNFIDTNSGGKIERRWNDKYYYLSSNNDSYLLGDSPVVYESSTETITLLGKKYLIGSDGSVVLNKDVVSFNDASQTNFYKLDDRVYLIIADEIYNSDKSIYASKYLLVYLDKQGNASLLNDAINIKTINPLKLIFGKYTFDVANEKLLVDKSIIDLKLVIGSTNEYVVPEKKEEIVDYDSKKLIDSYNRLVNNFTQYANNHEMVTSGNNQVSYNNVVINGNTTTSGTSSASTSVGSGGSSAKNKTNIIKRVSLRGSVSNPTYIDVSYVVTDPEDKYQAVYLLVTGSVDGVSSTEKIILDKYDTVYRVNNLSPNTEYTISLGNIEVVTDDAGDKNLVDNIEDVINVRSTKIKYELSVEKISSGYVYFNFKMPLSYALESGDVVLYTDGVKGDISVPLVYQSVISSSGFSGKLPMVDGGLFELRVENGVYNNEKVNIEISKKFKIS